MASSVNLGPALLLDIAGKRVGEGHRTPLNGNRPVTHAQIAANMALTGLLLTSVILTHRRGR